VRFLWLYVARRGFLDGRRGLLFCQLIAMYDFMIDAKLLERRLTVRSAPRQTAHSREERAS
jgi:hypothetical protein